MIIKQGVSYPKVIIIAKICVNINAILTKSRYEMNRETLEYLFMENIMAMTVANVRSVWLVF